VLFLFGFLVMLDWLVTQLRILMQKLLYCYQCLSVEVIMQCYCLYCLLLRVVEVIMQCYCLYCLLLHVVDVKM